MDYSKLWEILKEMRVPDHLTCLMRNLCARQEATVKNEHGKWTGSKLGKEYVKTIYCHLAYLTYIQSTLRKKKKKEGWINHKMESRLLRKISTTSEMQMILL